MKPDKAEPGSPKLRPLTGGKKPTRAGLAKAMRAVRLFLCDVDGILTDASVFMGGGVETKRFHIQDGLGLRLLQKEGIRVGWVSNRPSSATTMRAEDLKIDYLIQVQTPKVAAVEALLAEQGFAWEETLYMGDDVVDLGVLRRARVAVTVPHAVEEALKVADYVTIRQAGFGAVREVVEMVLKAQGKWDSVVKHYSS